MAEQATAVQVQATAVQAQAENKGKPWLPEEIQTLLTEIQQKKSHEQIATVHGRTVRSIQLKLRGIALDYHVNEQKSQEEITVLTGLTKEQIEEAIEEHSTVINATRKGQRWTDEETIKLLDLVKSKKTRVELAKEHQRSLTAITGRLQQIALDYLDQEFTNTQIKKFTGLSEEEIQEAVQKREAQAKTPTAFIEFLERVKERANPPTDIVEKVRTSLLSQGFKNWKKVDGKTIKNTLKALSLNEYTTSDNYILMKLRDQPIPPLTDEICENFKNLFIKFQPAYKAEEKPLPSQYACYKFCQLENLPELEVHFPIVNSKEKFAELEEIWLKFHE